MTRTLITGTSYVHGAAAAEIFSMWADITRRLNPRIDILVIDSASPTPLPVERWGADFDLCPFPDNIGHLSRGGRDGWGRAFMRGVRYAIESHYDWMVNIECDILFARPVAETIAKMERANVKCAAPMAFPHHFTETGLSFWSVPYLRDIDLIGKYDWENPPRGGPLPEQRIDAICADDVFALPFRGFRNDIGLSVAQMRAMFSSGIDWVHHVEIPMAREFLRMNGLDVEHV